MEYVYAALILNETGAEINENNLTDVLEAAGASVEQSRVKALVAALEDVDIDEAVEEAAPVAGGGGAAGAAAAPDDAPELEGGDEAEADDGDEAEADDGGDEAEADDGDEADGEGLGELFG
jgi:large subunit ribosomal protein L12